MVQRLDRDTVVDAVLSTITLEVPTLAAMPAEVVAGPLRSAVAGNLEMLLALLAEDRSYRPDEALAIGERCADLAVWGLRVEDVVAWFSVGTPVLWDHLARTSYPHELEPLLDACNRLLSIAGLIYDVAVAMAQQLPDALEDEAASRLLATSATAADPDARAAAERLGVDLDRARRPFVVRPAAGRPREHAALARRLRRAGAIAITRPGAIVGLAERPFEPHAVGADALVALGEPGDLGDLESRWNALADLAATAHLLGHRGTVAEPALLFERMLLAAPSIAATMALPIERLRTASRGEADLRSAARALVEANLNRQAAAAALGVHPSTLRYRAGRISAVTGLDLQRVHARCVVALGLKAAELERHRTAPPPPPREPPYPANVAADVAARVDRDALAAAIAAGYREHYPSFAALPDSDVALLPGVREGIDELLAILCDPRPQAELEFGRADERILEHLALGVTPEDTLRAAGLAGTMIWEALLAETTAQDRVVLPMVAGRLFRYASAITRAAKEAPRSAQPMPTSGSQELIDALTAAVSDPRRVHAAARNLGLDGDQPLRPVAATGHGVASGSQLASAFRTGGWPAAERGGQVIAVVPADLPLGQLPPSLLAAVGDGMPLDRLHDEVATTRSLLRIADQQGDRGLVVATDRSFELLIDANPALAAALRARVVGRLDSPAGRRGPDLVATLRAYLAADLDRQATARALHLHPNSLDHRLRRIAELTELSYTRIEDLLLLAGGVVADALGHRA
ncbi:PucR family transcriptional regulator [Patulibacter medicamentivorans]|uniref:PucR family transcriptional regulator n=1 Tax=Patulibacter medicamentivorans TaxID=1097667 RepID=UPI0002F117CF|nr:helix-turn-helix domain-containing protein [Patulibacter medicamentivorans]